MLVFAMQFSRINGLKREAPARARGAEAGKARQRRTFKAEQKTTARARELRQPVHQLGSSPW